MFRISPFFPLVLALILFPLCPLAVKKAHPLINLSQNQILKSYREHASHPPASLVKIMTAWLVLDAIRDGKISWSTPCKVPAHVRKIPNIKVGYVPNTFVSVYNLLLALLVHSANDAAYVLAANTYGGEKNFIKRMNEKAQQIGMSNTHFINPSGLPHRKQLSTAYDLALMIKHLLIEHPRHYALFGQPTFIHQGKTYYNSNPFLHTHSEIDGVKTGFVSASSYNIAVTMNRGKQKLLAIVLGEPTILARNDKVAHLLNIIKPRFSPKVRVVPCKGHPASKWSIQIGAFKNKLSARHFIKEVIHLYQDDIKDLEIFYLYKEGRIYKPRFGPYNELERCKEMCGQLKRKNVDCFVVGK